ncbi:MAG: CoB--CoM heterodisulfide reductase iron-sulfur subunit B family protein [Clostridia bacterium]|nr:CoB--CoM heterodisulfide reductase iron-sulfur subunit B family protein [Clostridia bacterium]
MKVRYFPGCTLKNKAQDLDLFARKSALALGIEMEEIPMWQCCGGVFVSANDEVATKLSSIRALSDAEEHHSPLVTVCSACHNVIKQTNHQFNTDSAFRQKAVNYLASDTVYQGGAEIYHYLEMLRDLVGFDEIKKKVVKPLTGRKIAVYYGCLLLRPNSVMKMDDPENPQIFESLIRALGAESVYYPMRNECCGGYIALESKELAEKKSRSVYESAKSAGADTIVTACPLCRYNLLKNNSPLPVVYFTELLAEALGAKEDSNE